MILNFINFHKIFYILGTLEGDFIKKPHGTGPFTLESHLPGEHIVYKRRKDYWQKGDDGHPLPYMEGIRITDMGNELAPVIAAIKTDEVDLIDLVKLAKRYRAVPGVRFTEETHHMDFNFNNEIDIGDLTTLAANIEG